MLNAKTVGVLGILPRIGTTTQALQLTRYLLQQQRFAAYIEMNSSNYVYKSLELYSTAKEDVQTSSGMITFMDIEMYTKDNLISAQKKSYDYLIKDYGNITDLEYQKISFLEQDIKIVVCGSKPNEIFNIEDPFLKDKDYADVFFIFNLTPQEDRKYLLDVMGKKSDRTFFAGVQPDPFSSIVPNPIYGDILNKSTRG